MTPKHDPSALTSTDARPVHGRLIIEDEYIATWMTLNNSFTRAPGEHWAVRTDTRYCGGILVQVGSFYEPPRCEIPEDELRRAVTVVAEKSDGTAKTTLQGFTWINVVTAERATLNPPMQPQHVSYIWAAPGSEGYRRKRLHELFLPFAAITYWPGPNRFTIRAEPAPVDENAPSRHNQYTFEFHDEMKMFVSRGLNPPEELKDLTTIRIQCSEQCLGHTNSHSDHDDPPW